MDRFKWRVPSDAYFRRHISEGEISTLEYRVDRYKFVWEEFGPPADMLLIGGIPAMFALDEMKRSFAYGNFMATVLLAQIFIEHSLGGRYTMAGKDDIAQRGFAGLVDASMDDGHITPQLAHTLHRLRKMRNPYTHHVSGTGPRTYMGRIAETFMAPEDLVVEDAKSAIRAVVDYLRHGAPDWNPHKIVWNEDDPC